MSLDSNEPKWYISSWWAVHAKFQTPPFSQISLGIVLVNALETCTSLFCRFEPCSIRWSWGFGWRVPSQVELLYLVEDGWRLWKHVEAEAVAGSTVSCCRSRGWVGSWRWTFGPRGQLSILDIYSKKLEDMWWCDDLGWQLFIVVPLSGSPLFVYRLVNLG